MVVPVTDVGRPQRFYSDKVGFVVDHDTRVSAEMRIVQLTPPGLACSIGLGIGVVDVPAEAFSSWCPTSRPPGLH